MLVFSFATVSFDVSKRSMSIAPKVSPEIVSISPLKSPLFKRMSQLLPAGKEGTARESNLLKGWAAARPAVLATARAVERYMACTASEEWKMQDAKTMIKGKQGQGMQVAGSTNASNECT